MEDHVPLGDEYVFHVGRESDVAAPSAPRRLGLILSERHASVVEDNHEALKRSARAQQHYRGAAQAALRALQHVEAEEHYPVSLGAFGLQLSVADVAHHRMG